jgi:hypothetical protein
MPRHSPFALKNLTNKIAKRPMLTTRKQNSLVMSLIHITRHAPRHTPTRKPEHYLIRACRCSRPLCSSQSTGGILPHHTTTQQAVIRVIRPGSRRPSPTPPPHSLSETQQQSGPVLQDPTACTKHTPHQQPSSTPDPKDQQY